MNRLEFQQKIFDFYPNEFTKDTVKRSYAWIEAFNRIFLNDDFDYEKLFFFFCSEYENFKIPPMPAFFKKYREICKITKKPENKKIEIFSKKEKEEGDKIARAFFEKFRQYKKLKKE